VERETEKKKIMMRLIKIALFGRRPRNMPAKIK
jgi:hypothetical protein